MKANSLHNNNLHDITSTIGNEFSGKKIILCVTGSVAAYKSIELARLLIRHGADITCVVSKSATKLIKPEYLKWATGNDVVTKLTGKLEHIQLADYKRSDIIIVYPATANVVGKLANGIDDTPLSTVLTVGLGSGIPIFISLAMHESMYNNISVIKNIKFLNKKINFITPKISEGKVKISEPKEVLEYILKKTPYNSKLCNKHILITAGPTVEYIDPIKVITNMSTGKTGILLAAELASVGAKVTLIYGRGIERPPDNVEVVYVETAKEMMDAIRYKMRKLFDIVILSAAVSDYIPNNKSKSKISSNKIVIQLHKLPKIINQIKKIQTNIFLVGFKAEACISEKNLINKSKKKIYESNADMIIANDVGDPRYKKNKGYNNIIIVDKKGFVRSGWKKKSAIVKFIRKIMEKKISE